jgi:hypothetical protein
MTWNISMAFRKPVMKPSNPSRWGNKGVKRACRVFLGIGRETESRKDLIQRIGELAEGVKELARMAVRQYSAAVEFILNEQSRDSGRIEKCLDGMLDFCFDDGALVLYKKLCRYYFEIDPEATVSYVHAYREMWDEQKRTCPRASIRASCEPPLEIPKGRCGRVSEDRRSG